MMNLTPGPASLNEIMVYGYFGCYEGENTLDEMQFVLLLLQYSNASTCRYMQTHAILCRLVAYVILTSN